MGNPLPRIVALGFLSYLIVNGVLLWWRSQTVGKALLELGGKSATANERVASELR